VASEPNRILSDTVKRPIPVIADTPLAPKPTKPALSKIDIVRGHTRIASVVNKVAKKPRVFRLGEICRTKRMKMEYLGLDLGTRNIVLAFKEENGEIGYLSEVNGYWPFERVTPFLKNMLDDPNKVRSDGTKRPARWIELDGQAIILGKDAEEFAYAKNDYLRRPMAEGGVAADEEAMTILSTIVTGLLQTAEDDIGKFGDGVKLCYCTTAKAINKDINLDYHTRVVNVILDSYETKSNIERHTIKESHAIVLDSSDDGTGIGISWGAGTVTDSYVNNRLEIFSFCWVGSGDWIDYETAQRHGFNADSRKKSKETPTTVSKRKMSVNLTPGKEPDDRLGMDIVLHYDILINNVLTGIIEGFKENENEARIEEGVNLYMAGGTASPAGFNDRCIKLIKELEVPFEINKVILCKSPLFTVARGCLKAAEMF
jgi:hypothetical protein